MADNKTISKIKVMDTTYDIKDAEVRQILEILLQNCPNKEDEKSSKNMA